MALDSKKELTPIHYSDYGTKIIYRYTFRPNVMPFSLHWHDRVELLRIHQGSLNLSCTDQNIVLRPGDIGIISSKMIHGALAGPEGVIYDVVMIDLNLLMNSTRTTSAYLQPLSDGSCIFEPLIQNDQIRHRFDSIVEAHHTADRQPLRILGELYDLVGLLYEHCVIRDVPVLTTQSQLGPVIDYINAHYSEDISSAFLSQKFGHEESYFGRKFKKHTGLTIMRYILILRMEKARKLLSETDLPVQDIATSCGFSDAAYFINRFKLLYRITPTQMRQRAKQNTFSFAEYNGNNPTKV